MAHIDFASFFSLNIFLALLIGSLIGMLLGALPGIGITITLALLIPFTYTLDPLTGLLLLLAAFQSCEYGGSISAIILNIPGTGAAVATTFDGYPLARNKSPGKALAYSLYSSSVGGLFGAAVLIFLSAPFSKFALLLSDPEYFLLGLLGVIGAVAVSGTDKLKAYISIILGMMAGTIGMDLFTGIPRFTMGQMALLDGIDIITLITGVFAFSELFLLISEWLHKKYKIEKENLSTRLTWKEFKGVSKATWTGSTLGAILGILPGLGSGSASIFSYVLAKKMSKSPETFGKGNPEGIAGPEAANNAAVGGALVPLLTLGIPGSIGTAIVMGAFIINGIIPGPKLFEKETNLVYGLMYGFVLTTVFMFVTGRLLTPFFSRVMTVPSRFLIPIVFVVSLIGVYATTNRFVDLWYALLIGIFFLAFRKAGFSIPGFLLAYVLCQIIEERFRRALMISDGSFAIFVTRPIALIILLIILALMFYPVIAKYIKNWKSNTAKTLDS